MFAAESFFFHVLRSSLLSWYLLVPSYCWVRVESGAGEAKGLPEKRVNMTGCVPWFPFYPFHWNLRVFSQLVFLSLSFIHSNIQYGSRIHQIGFHHRKDLFFSPPSLFAGSRARYPRQKREKSWQKMLFHKQKSIISSQLTGCNPLFQCLFSILSHPTGFIHNLQWTGFPHVTQMMALMTQNIGAIEQQFRGRMCSSILCVCQSRRKRMKGRTSEGRIRSTFFAGLSVCHMQSVWVPSVFSSNLMPELATC